MSAPARDAGFTLVEALVSLFVFSLIAAGSVVMLVQSAQSQRRVAAAHEELRALQLTRAMLVDDLSQMAPRTLRRPPGGAPVRVVGRDEGVALSFVRAGVVRDLASGAPNALSYVEYDIRGDQLVRRTSARLEAPLGADAGAQVLLEGAKNLRIEVFDGGVWRSDWVDVGAGGARAVRISAELPRYGPVQIDALVRQGGG